MSRTLFRHVAVAFAFAVLAVSSLAVGAEPEKECADCHGKDGASTENDVPIIGGLSEQYVLDSMAAYRDKKRPCNESKYRSGDTQRPKTDMCKIAAKLTEADTAKVAKHLAAEPFVRAKQPFDAAKATIGKKVHDMQCEKCHAEAGSSAEDDGGILAGQWMPYLKATFREYTDGKRPMPEKMKTKWGKLSPADREALLNFYASQQ